MRVPGASELIAVWEAGRAQGPVERALALLALALPEAGVDRLLDLPVGERDGLLLQLRAAIFGPRLESLVTCPACGERVELTFDSAEIRASAPALPDAAATIDVGGRALRFRLPTSRDLLFATQHADPRAGRRALIGRCLIDAAPESIDAAAERALADEIARRDPQADVRLALECPACGHAWEALFDIVSFLWSEVERWAVRLLHEVHLLASAYGWREADILALSPARRRVYLDLVSR